MPPSFYLNMENETRMNAKTIKVKHLKPEQYLVLGFAALISLGTLLLNLPVASASGRSMGFINALFEATSSVCVTGLTVVNTARDLTLFGQIVVLVLLQAGGLGFMTMATMIFLLLGKRITLRERLVMQQALNQFSIQGVVRMSRNILIFTFATELIGAVLLSFQFIPDFGLSKGIYFSVFHAISAFCNAGFDLMGDSFVRYTENYIVNLTVMALIVIGGIGFTVINDIRRQRRASRWSLHTKIVVFITGVLILAGFIFYFAVEYNHALAPYNASGKVLGALFQSITPRTAGFNTIPTDQLQPASKFVTILMMFVGASPASTGGGVKTVTAFVLLLAGISVMRGRDDVEIFRKKVPQDIIFRAIGIILVSFSVLFIITTALCLIEPLPFVDLLFETGSALGTVGLATINTGGLTGASKLLLVFAMFMGRVGPLTLTLAFARRRTITHTGIHYPEGRVLVG
jgi:trk system potassium uptake protein TrkH